MNLTDNGVRWLQFSERLAEIANNPNVTPAQELESILIESWMGNIDDRYKDLQPFIDFVLWKMNGKGLKVIKELKEGTGV